MSNSRTKIFRALLVMTAILFLYRLTNQDKERVSEFPGQTMGTVPYMVKVISTKSLDFTYGIDSVLKALNQSLSTYIPDSEISLLNRKDTLAFSSNLFFPVLEASQMVVRETNGAFDPTIGPLVNAWGFGPGRLPIDLDSATVDSLLQFVGFDQVSFDSYVAMKPKGTYIDFSAIAKGYAVDLVAEYLERNGVARYMVEIGGEVRAKGNNIENENWSIGIDDPLVSKEDRKILAIVGLENQSLATSGNYRNYYEKDGEIFAHIIDPRTGYNNFHSILSASVFADNCMLADAYATAFMVMGLEQSMDLVERLPTLEAILIYREDGELKSYVSEGIVDAVKMNQTADNSSL